MDAVDYPSGGDDFERPRMTEEERYARVKQRVGIGSQSKTDLWLERQCSNQWGKGVKARSDR